MSPTGPLATVRNVTLRDDVHSLLTGSAGDTDVPGAGSELADLPAELIDAAIGHFADTAPIDVTDELAPIVMATGPIPFDPDRMSSRSMTPSLSTTTRCRSLPSRPSMPPTTSETSR